MKNNTNNSEIPPLLQATSSEEPKIIGQDQARCRSNDQAASRHIRAEAKLRQPTNVA